MSDDIANRFNKQEAQVIAQAPILVFLLVSAADGTIDKHEIRRFESVLCSDAFKDLRALMDRSHLSIVDTLRLMTESSVDYLAELERIKRVLEARLAPAVAVRVKLQLHDLGQQIANASGSLLGVLGSPVSDQEQTALKVIAGLFGIDEHQC